MKAVIVGCSRLGARLATALAERGMTVSVVDVDAASFRRLPDDFTGHTVIGTGIDEDVLIEAGISNADIFVSATNGDNRNIMAAQLARFGFHVEHVLCRIYDPVRAETYRHLGIETVCPTVEIANLFLNAIDTRAGKAT
ncbi:MAG: TrkA family potassium uptake protein [Chloroflexota bacterium]|nr:TrkA family potassium uptake protein [Chloroflexota bacterium]